MMVPIWNTVDVLVPGLLQVQVQGRSERDDGRGHPLNVGGFHPLNLLGVRPEYSGWGGR